MGNMGKQILLDKKAEIIRLHTEEELSVTEIIDEIGGKGKSIKKFLIDEGVYNPEYSKYYRKNKQIRAFLEEGKSLVEIMELLNIGQKALKERIKANDLGKGLEVVYKKPKKQRQKKKCINDDRHLCETCKYRCITRLKYLGFNCNYIGIVGHSRGCKVCDCNKYVEGEGVDL